MAMSADGGYVAFGGNGGYAHVFSGKYKTKCFDVKMNCPLRALAFRGDSTLLTSGLDSEVYVWDLRHTARCLQRLVSFLISLRLRLRSYLDLKIFEYRWNLHDFDCII